MSAEIETVLVTGGTGFVASWCLVELLQRGYAVRTTVRDLSKAAGLRAAIAQVTDPGERLSFHVADLTRDEGWDAAVAGCDYVLHVASPLGDLERGDPAALVAPARDGTLRVLAAATRAGVRRVVMTSAAAAARPPVGSDLVSDETMWADPVAQNFDAYRKSKVLAERAAWDFMAGGVKGGTTFATVLPGAVFGPVLMRENPGSVKIIERLLAGRPPGIPRLGFWIVDVRDLADLHIRAMLTPAAAGERFLAAGDFMWLAEIAGTLKSELGDQARKVTTLRLPDGVFKLLARFVPPLRMLVPMLGRVNPLSAEKARRVLGFSPRPATATVVDCARSLLAER